jgi:hypothetical protein
VRFVDSFDTAQPGAATRADAHPGFAQRLHIQIAADDAIAQGLPA